MLGHKYGFITTDGKWLIAPKYDFAEDLSDGLAVVCLDKKYGFIDATGKEVLPLSYDFARKFSAGLAPVKKGSAWGYIDAKGNWVLPAKYDDAYYFNSNGQARVTINKELFMIDKTGTVIKKIEMHNEEEERERGHGKTGGSKDKD
jgi:hypothetical protein